MCYVDNGNVLGALDLFDLTAHFFAECSVQIGEWLIQKKKLWLHDQCAGKGDTLLLSAGQLVSHTVF